MIKPVIALATATALLVSSAAPSFANNGWHGGGGWHGGWHHHGGGWGRRACRGSRRRPWSARRRDSHGSLLQLPLSLWVAVRIWVCAPARLWLWLRPLLRSVALRGGRASRPN